MLSQVLSGIGLKVPEPLSSTTIYMVAAQVAWLKMSLSTKLPLIVVIIFTAVDTVESYEYARDESTVDDLLLGLGQLTFRMKLFDCWTTPLKVNLTYTVTAVFGKVVSAKLTLSCPEVKV